MVRARIATRRLGITGNPDYGSAAFTDFSSVTPETRLEQLNLNWRERDLPEWQRTKHVHRLHPYLGKFVPQLVEIFLRKYRPSVVCDPFCGSGTTLVEAKALGIHAVGCDISVFNCLVTKVKTAEYDVDRVEKDTRDILSELAVALRSDGRIPAGDTTRYLREWYAPQALRELLLYRRLIPNYTYQDVLKVILSRAARSARLTTHFDLDFPKRPQRDPYYCHKHRRWCRPTKSALKFLTRYSSDTLRRIAAFSEFRTSAAIHILCGDARDMDFPECDMVLTSPPYVGLIDYHEQHRYAFQLLGLPSQEPLEIGPASGGNSRLAVRRYVRDMVQAFQNVMRGLQPGGALVVVVHDRRNLYEEIGQNLGVRTEYRFARHVNRRTGRRAADFFEDVIVWRCP